MPQVSFTIEARIKPTTLTNTYGSGRILGWGPDRASESGDSYNFINFLFAYSGYSNQFRLELRVGPAFYHTYSNTPPVDLLDGSWHHVAAL
eukprot:5161831-Amphidinium_carterae.1